MAAKVTIGFECRISIHLTNVITNVIPKMLVVLLLYTQEAQWLLECSLGKDLLIIHRTSIPPRIRQEQYHLAQHTMMAGFPRMS